MDNYKAQFLPSHKNKLTAINVKEIKNIVDDLINYILSSMDEDAKKDVERFVFKETHVPFWINDDGKIKLGHTDT
jgi:hypothetical protein